MTHSRTAALTVCALLLAGAASAQNAPPRPAMITNPSWASIPDADTMAEAHPAFASMAGLPGVVTLSCLARADGNLTGCTVLRAAPAGVGFDRAALSLIPEFRISPRTVNGAEVGARVQFNIRFLPPEPKPVLPWTGAEPSPEHIRNASALVARFDRDMAAEFEEELQHLDVDTDREDAVRAIVRQVDAEFADRQKAAAALGMARMLSPSQLTLFANGLPPSEPPPSEETMTRAGDRAMALDAEQSLRLKTLYCARYECPAIGPPPRDAVRGGLRN